MNEETQVGKGTSGEFSGYANLVAIRSFSGKKNLHEAPLVSQTLVNVPGRGIAGHFKYAQHDKQSIPVACATLMEAEVSAINKGWRRGPSFH